MKQRNNRTILKGLLILIVGILLWFLISTPKPKSLLTYFWSSDTLDYAKLETIKQLLQKEYVQPELLTEKKAEMLEKAVAGFVNGLDDPYTVYLTAEEHTTLQQALKEESGIEGIGAVIEKKEHYIQIAEIIKNGPAHKAGLQPLDRILVINSWATQNLTLNEAIEQIRGEKGTVVQLFIHRESKNENTDNKTFRVQITRDKIDLPSVLATCVEYENTNIGIFEISSISEYTTKIFINEALSCIRKGMQGIILDLRGNNGGYLEEASKFLGHFLPKGETAVKSEYQAFDNKIFTSKGRGELKNYPLVIIVDQLTASAGEIIALTLQEKGALVIWMPTLGKGSIQAIEQFKDGSSLKYTVGKRYSPNNASIDNIGLTPNAILARDHEAYAKQAYDNQLEEAKKTLATLMTEQ